MIKERTIKILLADDHTIIRQGIQLVIESLFHDTELHHATSIRQIKQLTENKTFDLAILDAQLSDGNCIHILPEIKTKNAQTKILIFSSYDETKYALQFIKAGADGYLSKLSEASEIEHAIYEVLDKGYYYSTLTRTLLNHSLQNHASLNPLDQLSERELEIAKLYAKGLGNLEIAGALNIAQNTVSTYKKRIFEKLNIESIIDLMRIMGDYHDF